MTAYVQPEKLLKETLDMLKCGELKIFQWYVTLYEKDGRRPIPRSQLENATREDTADKLVQVFGGDGSVEITVDVLLRMQHNNIATILIQEKAELAAHPCIKMQSFPPFCAPLKGSNPSVSHSVAPCVQPLCSTSCGTQTESVEPSVEPSCSTIRETFTKSVEEPQQETPTPPASKKQIHNKKTNSEKPLSSSATQIHIESVVSTPAEPQSYSDTTKLANENLICPICFDIFTNPVVLQCGHSFCQKCVRLYWKTQDLPKCAVCRHLVISPTLQINYVLKNMSDEARKINKTWNMKEQKRVISESHQEPSIIVKEKQQDFEKVKQRCDLLTDANRGPSKIVKEKQQEFEKVKQHYSLQNEANQRNSSEAVKKIEKDFHTMLVFLKREKDTRVSALKQENDESIRKMELLTELSRDTFSLSDTVKELKSLGVDDSFVKAYNSKLQRLQDMLSNPEALPQTTIDVERYSENLKFQVWEKMFDIVKSDMIGGLVSGAIQLGPENQACNFNHLPRRERAQESIAGQEKVKSKVSAKGERGHMKIPPKK